MTEDEAKQKWCPFVRWLPETEHMHMSSNRPAQMDAVCIGSACMAWRPHLVEDNAPLSESHKLRALAAEKKWKTKEDAYYFSVFEPHGYCGLAGKP